MKNFSRRSFLGALGLGSATTAMSVILPSFSGEARRRSSSYSGKKLNIALCGLGNYAGLLADGLALSQYCKLAGIITGTPSKAEVWEKNHNIPANNIYNYNNFDEIVSNKDIDLIYVVTPNALHKEFVIRAAKAGKHVITEKPMATSVNDCEEMIAACKSANVKLAVGYRLHYEPSHLEIKKLGQEKVFGEVRFIEAALGYQTFSPEKWKVSDFNPDSRSEWRLKKSLSGGGPLMDLGIYCVQASRYVLGEEPVAVTAQMGPINNTTLFSEVEETISWQMEFPSGAVSNCVSSYGFNIDRFFASADKGFFELSPGLSYGPFIGRTSAGELKFPIINQQATQLDAIGKLILENKPLPDHITGEEGIRDIRIIERIYEVAASGKRVEINKT